MSVRVFPNNNGLPLYYHYENSNDSIKKTIDDLRSIKRDVINGGYSHYKAQDVLQLLSSIEHDLRSFTEIKQKAPFRV